MGERRRREAEMLGRGRERIAEEIAAGVVRVSQERIAEMRGEIEREEERMRRRVEEVFGVVGRDVSLGVWSKDQDSDVFVVEKSLGEMKRWVGKERARIIFDSKKDEFTNASFNAKCMNQPNIALIGFTTDGDVFGGYLEKEVSETDEYLPDPNHFIFSLESHGRCKTPMRFLRKEEKREISAVFWHTNCSCGFIYFGDGYGGGFWLGNMESKLYSFNLSSEYDGIENTTLTGKNGTWDGPYYHCKRLVVVQFH